MPKVPNVTHVSATAFLTHLFRPPIGGVQEHAHGGNPSQPLVVAGEVSLRCHVIHLPLRIEHVIFLDGVDLSECRIEGSLRIEGCTFRKGLCLRDIQVRGNLFLKRSRLTDREHRWLDFRRMAVAGITDLTATTAAVGIDFSNSILDDDLRLDGFHGATALQNQSRIPAHLPLQTRAHLEQEMLGKALNFEGMELRAHFYCYAFAERGLRIWGQVDLRAKVGGAVAFSSARVEVEKQAKAVNMGAADVAGSVFFRDTTITGQVDLRAKVGGGVEFLSATVEVEKHARAVNMDGADVAGSVFFENITITGQVDLQAKVGGQVEFLSATVEVEKHARAVNMAAADVAKSVFFTGTTITGQVDLRGRIGGQVNFKFSNIEVAKNTKAVDMDAADVAESVFFINTTITGQVDLRGRTGGQINFICATVEVEPSNLALTMNNAVVAETVFFSSGTRFTGWLNLSNAKIGGGLEFSATMTDAIVPWGVMLDAADIAGIARFINGTRVRGGIRCRETVFRKSLQVTNDPERKDFSLPIASDETVRRELFCSGPFDLSFATVHGPAHFHGASIAGGIRASHLTVHGDLDICGCEIAKRSGSRVGWPDNFNGVIRTAEQEQKDLAATYRKAESDEIRKALADRLARGWSRWIADEVEAKMTSPHDTLALDLKMARVHGRLWMKSTRAHGSIDLEDARIEGEAFFQQTTVAGDMKLRSAEVQGRVFADEQTESDTPSYPRVLGHVDLSYSRLSQVDVKFGRDDALVVTRPAFLNLTGATIGSMNLRGDAGLLKTEDGGQRRGILVTDGLTFKDLAVDRGVYARTPKLPVRDALRVLLWIAAACAVGWLAYASTGTTPQDRARLDGVIVLGTTYVVFCLVSAIHRWLIAPRFEPGGLASTRTPSRPILDMLDQTYPFSRSFYIAVENWFRSSGDTANADEVFLMRRRRETNPPDIQGPNVLEGPSKKDPALKERWQTPSLPQRAWTLFVDFFLGFGVRWPRLVHVWVILFLLNVALFCSPISVERPLAYVQPAVAADTSAGEDQPYWPAEGGKPKDEEWTWVNASFMSLRVQVPFLALVAENDWEPSSKPSPIAGITYEEWASLMMALNFVLIPLIVAGLTQQFRSRGDD